MTREEIEGMPAGRTMDSLIESEIFNHIVFWVEEKRQTSEINPRKNRTYYVKEPKYNLGYTYHNPVLDYSGSIDFSFRVLRKLGELGFLWSISNDTNGRGTECVCVRIYKAEKCFYTLADTAPLGICRVALIATMESKDVSIL